MIVLIWFAFTHVLFKDIFKSVWISIIFCEFCILQFADWVDLGRIVFSFVMKDLIYKEWWGRGVS